MHPSRACRKLCARRKGGGDEAERISVVEQNEMGQEAAHDKESKAFKESNSLAMRLILSSLLLCLTTAVKVE